MISKDNAPVGWALLMYELEDAQEHLGNLIQAMSSQPDYAEEEFRIDIGHVFAHLNRAWHTRDEVDGPDKTKWHEASRFPTDLAPI